MSLACYTLAAPENAVSSESYWWIWPSAQDVKVYGSCQHLKLSTLSDKMEMSLTLELAKNDIYIQSSYSTLVSRSSAEFILRSHRGIARTELSRRDFLVQIEILCFDRGYVVPPKV
jgi:hypothetical protein